MIRSSRTSLYGCDAAGANYGSLIVLFTRASGMQSLGPGGDMSFYDNGSSSRVQAWSM